MVGVAGEKCLQGGVFVTIEFNTWSDFRSYDFQASGFGGFL